MSYQGEDIKFTLKGDANVNLDEITNFVVSVYPHCQCEGTTSNIVRLYKATNFEQVKDKDGNGTNTYIGTIPASETKTMEATHYNMELLIIDGGERSIFMQKHAFAIECSVSKDVES